MAAIPHPWRAYARLQNQALRGRRADARSWAAEAGLDYIVSALPETEPPAEVVARAVATAQRREVHRAFVRRRWGAGQGMTIHPEPAMHARLTLQALSRCLPRADWDLLCQVGAGRGYDEIKAGGSRPEALRVRVLRLRRALAAGSAA